MFKKMEAEIKQIQNLDTALYEQRLKLEYLYEEKILGITPEELVAEQKMILRKRKKDKQIDELLAS